MLRERDPNDTYPIMTTNGNTVAHLLDVIADPQGNQPRFAVLHLFDNVTDHHPFTVVPWELLKIDRPSGNIVIQTSVDKLRKAPSFQQQDVPKQMQGNWPQQVYSFYGVQPAAAMGGSGMLPSGTLRGSDGNMPQPSNPARGSRTFLWTAIGASVLLLLLFVINRRRVSDRD